jgi:hypothetical protein
VNAEGGFHPLTPLQREILAFLLAEEFAGVDALREQLAVALSKERPDWDDFDLSIPVPARPAPSHPGVPVEAHYYNREEALRVGYPGDSPIIEVWLALDAAGYMAAVEFIYNVPKSMLARIPHIDEFTRAVREWRFLDDIK